MIRHAPLNFSKTPVNLSIGFYNIADKHSALHGCKLDNQVKLEFDIEILAETWSKCKKCANNNVDNYELIDSVDPLKKAGCKKGRDSGGILLFSKKK